ncbi:MAG: sugar transferase [Gemmatimonadetes bacterium]|nr:sugar transferase [Gemmatimonadota bacterium]
MNEVLVSIPMEKRSTYAFLKRTADILVAGVFLLAFLPLFLMIALLIRIDSPGPVIFRQVRVGKDGKRFNFYKFRSMVKDAEQLKQSLQDQNEAEQPLFKIRRDPRITRLGKFLRLSSLDEVPQLFNVLRGDLTLVGPRPHLPEEVREYTEAHRIRLSVTPGITCLWQANHRLSTKFVDWIESDIRYVNERSFALDLKILWDTLITVLSRRNAS